MAKSVRPFLKYFVHEFDLLRHSMTLTFDLLNPKVDHFILLSGGPLLPISIKIDSLAPLLVAASGAYSISEDDCLSVSVGWVPKMTYSVSSFLACNSYDCVAPYVDIILHRGRF